MFNWKETALLHHFKKKHSMMKKYDLLCVLEKNWNAHQSSRPARAFFKIDSLAHVQVWVDALNLPTKASLLKNRKALQVRVTAAVKDMMERAFRGQFASTREENSWYAVGIKQALPFSKSLVEDIVGESKDREDLFLRGSTKNQRLKTSFS